MTDLPPTPAGAPVPPPTDAAAPPVKQRNVLGIVALVVSAIGFVFACIPGALIVGWVLLPIGFILGLVALFLKGTKWPAIVAVIASVVGTVIGFVVFFSVVATAFDDSFGSGDTSAVETEGTSDEVDAEDAEQDADAATADYAVTIGGSTQTTDYEGNPALIVNFTFTNNSDEDANFMFATSAQAFQDGVELELAIITDDSFDSGSALKDVKPGTSIEVQQAFLLDGTADVLVEVTELLSFDDTLLATQTFSVQ